MAIRSLRSRLLSRRIQQLESRYLLTTLSSGEEVLDSFPAGFSESFDFQVNQGDFVRVAVGETGGLLAHPILHVFDGSGTQVDVNDGSDHAEVQIQNATAGNYTAIVTDSGDDQPMSFRIRAITLPSSPILIGGRDAVLSSGEEVLSSIPLGGFSVFRIAVESGDTLRISVGERGDTAAHPTLQLFDGNGEYLDHDDGHNNAEIQLANATAGVYTAIVTDNGDSHPMDFRIRAVALPSNPLLISGRDQSLANAEEFQASLPVGGFNLYRFEVGEGDSVRVSVGEIGNSVAQPLLQLFDSNGVRIDHDHDDNNAEIQMFNATAGTYTAIVTANGNDYPIDYRIRAISIPDTPVLIPGRDQQLANGEEVLASIPAGGFNVYRFDVADGSTVRVSVGETGDFSAHPVLQVFAPNGVRSDSDNGSDNAEVQISNATAGTYTAIVTDNGNDLPMDFRLRAVAIPGTPLLIPGRDQELASGEEVEASIPVGGFNLYRFTVTEESFIHISVGEMGSLAGNPLLQLFDSSGQRLSFNTDSEDAFLQFDAIAAGTYTAVVHDNGNNDAMDFRIRLLTLPGTPEMLAGRDQDLLDGLSWEANVPEGGFNVHRFDANAGDTISVEVEWLAGGEPFVSVIGPDGDPIDDDSGFPAVLNFTAGLTGVYTMYVTDSRNDDPLDYRITMSGASGTFSPLAGAELFYNDSAFDQPTDAAAISSKAPLSIGQTSSFANFSSYSSGINGVMIDVAELAQPALIGPDDFTFRTGRTDNPSTWQEVAIPPTITVNENLGSGGSDRIVLTWPDGTITGTWLEITVEPTANTGISTAQRIYFGNQVGDTNGDGLTNATDFQNIRTHLANFLDPADVDNLFDINRDGRVNAIDLALVRDNATLLADGLPEITPQLPVNKASTDLGLIFIPESLSRQKGEANEQSNHASEAETIAGQELLIDLALLQEYSRK